jgi:malate dehydrogenase (oxaloacetate-decarboxylating)
MRCDTRIDPITGEEYLAVDARGRALLADPLTNKGTAFPLAERARLGLDGLVPPAVSTMAQQLERVYENFKAKQTDLERYIHLVSLQDRNETLFFRLVHEHIDEMMPIVYTPVVGEACQKFSHIYRRARGLYISYEDRDRIETILRNHGRAPAVIVVTDGERILGLGDQGAGGMGIPIGKLGLYTACAGIPPQLTLPIMLDVGTDNEARLSDPLYVGARHWRIRGEAYQAFVDRFVEGVARVYPNAVLQWEDFLKGNAIAQLQRFRDRLCTFNDDIQGTAAVVLSGIYTALRISGGSIRDQRVLLAGAGASAQGIGELIVAALRDAGLTEDEARTRIAMVDSRGLVTRERAGLEPFKAAFARTSQEVAAYACADRSAISLAEAVANMEPTILLGTSGTGGLFTEAVVAAMAAVNERPIVFPLSNPTSKSECTAEQALRWSGGRAVVATGSPFAPVDFGGRAHRIGQCNNSFIFPGVGLGLWVGKVRRVTDGMFLDAAKALAEQVTASDLASGAVYPELTRIRSCSRGVACAVIRRAAQEGHADPSSLEGLDERVARAMWRPEYRPIRYEPLLQRNGRSSDCVVDAPVADSRSRRTGR